MLEEIGYLGLTVLTGACTAWSVVAHLAAYTDKIPSAFAVPVLPLWATLTVATVFLIVLEKHHSARMRRINGCSLPPSYPHRDPILGIDALLRLQDAFNQNRMMEELDKWFRELGKTFAMADMGAPQLITCDADNIQTILTTNFQDWVIGGVRKRLMELILGPHAIFSINGAEWSHSRKMMRPVFVRDQLADLQCTDRHVENLLRRIPRNGETLNLQKLFYLFTMDLSTDFMFGFSTSTLTDPTFDAQDFLDCFDYATRTAAKRGRLSRLGMLVPDRRFSHSVKTCADFVDRYTERAIASKQEKERPYIFLAELVAADVPRDVMRHQMLSMILGGRDTSASTLSSLFWVLARRPDITAKMREDIASLQGRRPTWEELKGLKYLNMVSKEALRLFAPVATNSRVAARDTVLPKGGGPDGQAPIFVRKGTSCRWSTWSLHRHEDYWGEDAHEFRPERWEGMKTSWQYLPFSGGPRICIGQQFAQTMMLYTIARIFQEFGTIEARDDLPMQHQPGANIYLVNGVWVGLREA
jgi:cytochrome P450